ncbi:MAG: hypothetical protein HW403_194 [Dehalococcoidia bacterium]|nr:hypothetical protein [Dehalococcoidia bacterium]
MHNTIAIALREIRSFFATPMSYIVAASFLLISGFLFAQNLVDVQVANMRGFFAPASFFLLLLCPALTMRLLAEEQKMGTIELLLTAPIRDYEVVLGKFLASLVMVMGMIFLTLYYVLLLVWIGDPDMGPVFSGYLGLLLLSSALLSVGLLASSFTSNQVVAFTVSFGALILLSVIGGAGSFLGSASWATPVRAVFTYLGIFNHFTDMVRGVVDTRDVIYYISFTAGALFLTVRSLEARRWR